MFKFSDYQVPLKCYIYGYINYKNVYVDKKSIGEFTGSLKDYKVSIAADHLYQKGVKRSIAEKMIRFSIHFETVISIFILFFHFLLALAKKVVSRRVVLQNQVLIYSSGIQEQRLINLLKSAEIDDFVVVKISGKKNKYSQKLSYSLYSGIRTLQIVKAALYSVYFIFFMKNKYGKKDCLFRSYSFFEYLLVYCSLSNLDKSNSLLFFDTISRWAYLFCSSSLTKTFVQHGKISGRVNYVKLRNIDVAYYISESQRNILEKCLIGCKPKYKYRKLFEFAGDEKIKHTGKKNVLVVCRETLMARQMSVVDLLSSCSVNIYLKPHPSDKYDEYLSLQNKYPEVSILDRYDYPEVDFVISYDSSLADEYEMHNIPVLKYNDENFESSIVKWFNC